jgi:hypothetical protein
MILSFAMRPTPVNPASQYCTDVPLTPNARAKGRAAGMPAKHDDAPRRVPLSTLFGSRRQRTTGLNLRFRNQACSLATIPAASD